MTQTGLIGVEQHETADGILVIKLNYRADPIKRLPEEIREARRGLSERQWLQQMENRWDVASGLPIYADDWNREIHVARGHIEPRLDLDLISGWDFGLQPACVWCQVSPSGALAVLRELVTWNGRGAVKQQGVERLYSQFLLVTRRYYPDMEWREAYADPAGWSKQQTDERTCVELLADGGRGLDVRPGPVSFEQRRAAMTRILRTIHGSEPKLLVDPSCAMLIEGFEGAYRFKESVQQGLYHKRPEKNAWSHVMNALEYVVGAIFGAPDDPTDDEEEESARERPYIELTPDHRAKERASRYY